MGFSVNQRNSLRSPHVRGKDTRRQRDDSVRGITPACAGKRQVFLTARILVEDHPRVCGEKNSIALPFWRWMGSPPRVRGKVKRLTLCVLSERITPACSGKSRWPVCSPAVTRDHPRVCGEKETCEWIGRYKQGSPPRVRGKGSGYRSRSTSARITPACAGKSFCIWSDVTMA